MAWLERFLYAIVPLLFILLFGFLRGMTPNVLIRKRLRLSILLLLGALALGLVYTWSMLSLPGPTPGPDAAAPQERLRTFYFLLVALAAINAAVVLLFNRFKQQAASDKYPGIVQDTVVIGFFAVTATYWWPEELLATSAVGAVIIGFALQDTLGNLFSGLAIQVEKPFRVGDWIRVAENEGLVLEVTWRATKIRTKAGNFVIIPNSLISRDKIVNYSQPERLLRIEHVIGLGYEAHPNQVKRIILEAMADVPEVLRDPAPDVLLSQYADFAIQYRCRFWVDDFALTEPILDKFTTLLYYRLKRAGLVIPFPIRDVRVTERAPMPPELEIVPDRRQEFVDKVDLFRVLAPTDKRLIAQVMEAVTFAANETIIRQSTAGNSMVFIRTGSVRIVLEKGGENHEIAVLSDGQHFGEMSLLTGEPRVASAVAAEDVQAYVLRKDDFRSVLLERPEIVSQMSRVMAERKQTLKERAAQVAVHGLSAKEAQENFLQRIQRFFGLAP